MAELFRITTEQTEPLTLDGLGRGQFRVRVVNLSGRPLFTTAHVVPQDERVQSWFQIAPPVDRHFAIGASFDYVVNINAKALAQPGTYKYRFAMRITDSVSEEPETLSNELTLTLARRVLPWRTLLALLLLIIAAGAVIGAFFGSDWLTTNRLAPTITALAGDRFFLDRESFELVATIDAQRTRIAEATATLVPQVQEIARLNRENQAQRADIATLESDVSSLVSRLRDANIRLATDGAITASLQRNVVVVTVRNNSQIPISGQVRVSAYFGDDDLFFRRFSLSNQSADVANLAPNSTTTLRINVRGEGDLVGYTAWLAVPNDINLSNNYVSEIRQ